MVKAIGIGTLIFIAIEVVGLVSVELTGIRSSKP